VRLFVAIEIPSEIRKAFAAFLAELRAVAPAAKWVRAENLHVTLKFLGHTDPSNLEKIVEALRMIRNSHPVTLEFCGLGFFPNERRPRVFWAGMDAPPNLQPLAQAVDRGLHAIGFPLEERPFAPHLTLARFNPPGLPPALAAFAKQRGSRGFGSMTAREFHLIESKLNPSGAEYTTLQSFSFVAEN
jgi:RNA 2',3'-cyclic 3'-phosphodiesterase